MNQDNGSVDCDYSDCLSLSALFNFRCQFYSFFSVILLDSTKHPRLNWTTHKAGQIDSQNYSQNYGVSFFGEIELA